MYVEEMDLSSYPVKAHSSPDGNRYVEGPKPATHVWRVDYEDSNGYTKWEFWRAERSSPQAEIPYDEIRILEKRMQKPHKITAVKFGLIYDQKEPGGPWEAFHPNDKDPRAEKYYIGDYTEKYMTIWRKAAYDNHFDPFKLTRAYSKEDQVKRELDAKEKYIKDLEEKVVAERTKNQELILKNNDLIKKANPKAEK